MIVFLILKDQCVVLWKIFHKVILQKQTKFPKKIFVLIIAKMSNAFESLNAKIWVIAIVIAIKITNASIENKLVTEEIIKNHKENTSSY